MIRTLGVVSALAAGSLLLAACGGDDAAPSDAVSVTIDAAAADDADVTFTQGMIPHHDQAIEMAALAADRSKNPEILAIAERIEGAQDPEIEQMRGWLDAWGREEMASEMEGMDHGPSGMMTDEDMQELMAATGAEFDRLFVQMMIEHHEGAIAMAQTVLDDGADPRVEALAEAIISAQSAEIEEMQGLDLDG